VAIIRLVAKVDTLSVVSKAFERILHDQVLNHVNGRNLLSDFQAYLSRGHNTTIVLVRVTEDLRSAKAEGSRCMCS
jgi:hypothetical protein